MIHQEHHLEFQKTGRYFTYGDPKSAKHLLVAFHGYGYLAANFIKKFEILNSKDYYVVCPEALHRFYLKGTNGKVGASWMTKEDRLFDIQDNIIFLNKLISSILSNYTFERKIILGFSQGGATASRFIAYSNHSFDLFILWATVFPNDMEGNYHSKFNISKNYFVIGNKDEYYTTDVMAEHLKLIEKSGVKFEFVKFEGNHTVNSETLLQILK